MIDNRSLEVVLGNNEIEKLCNRRFGIGADGLILLEPSANCDFKMKYYNSDGRESSMCGNGGRCIAAFASFLGIVTNEARFEAIDGIHEASISAGENGNMVVSLSMGDVNTIRQLNGAYEMNTGSPHYVAFADNFATLDVVESGRKIRNSEPYKSQGINVNFVTAESNSFAMRTYERGVEDETWSCGTGTVAAAIALDMKGKTQQGKPVRISTKGGNLEVSFEKAGNEYKKIRLIGPAVRVYDGMINID